MHRLTLARVCAPRPATLFNHHVLAAGGDFCLTKKASLRVEHSFAVTFCSFAVSTRPYTAMLNTAKNDLLELCSYP